MSKTAIHVPNELFAPAESSSFSGEYSLDVLKSNTDVFTFNDPLRWQVTLTNTGGALLVIGSVEGKAQTSCARCLLSFDFDIRGEIEGYVLLSSEEEIPEDLDEDEYSILPADHILDLEPLILAALLLEVPLIPLCDYECKGLCATCGANLNEESCSCSKAESTEQDKESPFSVLKDFFPEK